MNQALKNALQEGVADAFGFVLGALAGWKLGLALGFDFVGSAAWGLPQITGLLLILAGCGAGRLLCRSLLAHWRQTH
ncbi:hypothetical protein [Roseateles koreensis]|uniref:Uncharacterized protein n=1 Tax=Roseateles koreensis TaxID=2987526 RepID=A0ABT5KZA8_9BURK|nr:hypothetical protein [Roseateles koreensis]MDC8787146.1 hypothetical protein [Roseateles koreensis]